jgi:hypothetical protein
MSIEELHSPVISKKRITDHGEVFTNPQEVNSMLDLVQNECQRIESRFLEPACGDGNFLIVVLSRKLFIVENRYKKNQIEFERYSFIAIASIYGIDLLKDNVEKCKKRLLKILKETYKRLFKNINEVFFQSCEFILSKNIICGDALSLKTLDPEPVPIVFSEWSEIKAGIIKRRDYTFEGLLIDAENEIPFLRSDLGEGVYIPRPIRDYPLTNYLRISQCQ